MNKVNFLIISAIVITSILIPKIRMKNSTYTTLTLSLLLISLLSLFYTHINKNILVLLIILYTIYVSYFISKNKKLTVSDKNYMYTIVVFLWLIYCLIYIFKSQSLLNEQYSGSDNIILNKDKHRLLKYNTSNIDMSALDVSDNRLLNNVRRRLLMDKTSHLSMNELNILDDILSKYIDNDYVKNRIIDIHHINENINLDNNM